MRVFARHALVPAAQPPGERWLLLEGSWPGDAAANSGRWALDDTITAAACGWIDAAAADFAERAIAAAASLDGGDVVDLLALRLRYGAVKWLRLVAFWQNLPPAERPRRVRLFVEADRDAEYVALAQSLAAAFRFELQVSTVPPQATVRRRTPVGDPLWRRLLAACVVSPPAKASRAARTTSRTPQVVLCGNPRILDPVCDELLRRRVGASWIIDRFALRPWWSRRALDIGWLVCNGRVADGVATALVDMSPLWFADVDFGPVVQAWLTLEQTRGVANVRGRRSLVREQFHRCLPTHVVVDEDATPWKRLVLDEARRYGAASLVVQHGVCGIRFGFAPLKADGICVYDETSARQLAAWGVPGDRIHVTGSPHQAELVAKARQLRPAMTRSLRRRILLLTTTPPRDERPDAVEFGLTTRTYAAMLDFALTAIGELCEIELVVRRHPRASADGALEHALAKLPDSVVRLPAKGTLVEQLAAADCVVSCASSSGLDAAAAGLPVVQLLPPGSGNIVPAEQYGLLGSARNLDEMRTLLGEALRRAAVSDSAFPVSAWKTVPAARVVDQLLHGRQDASRAVDVEPTSLAAEASRGAHAA